MHHALVNAARHSDRNPANAKCLMPPRPTGKLDMDSLEPCPS